MIFFMHGMHAILYTNLTSNLLQILFSIRWVAAFSSLMMLGKTVNGEFNVNVTQPTAIWSAEKSRKILQKKKMIWKIRWISQFVQWKKMDNFYIVTTKNSLHLLYIEIGMKEIAHLEKKNAYLTKNPWEMPNIFSQMHKNSITCVQRMMWKPPRLRAF